MSNRISHRSAGPGAGRQFRTARDAMPRPSLRFLFTLSVLFAAGCAPSPDAGIAKESITTHFEQRGYLVQEISIGKISRNPIAEREYMAPLTYVVDVRSIALRPREAAGEPAGDPEAGQLSFSAVSVKIQALSPPRQGWVVSQVSGIDLP